MIKIKISMTCLYKANEVKIGMVQEQWLQLKMFWGGDITKKSLLVWGIKLWLGKQNLVGESTFYKINHFCPLSCLPSNIISEKPNEKL